MTKTNLKLRALVAPAPAVVAAAYDPQGRPSACMLAFYMPSSHQPPCVTIAINATAKRKTLECILERGAFTVNYPDAAHAEAADYLGVETGHAADKLAAAGLTATRGSVVDAPVIDQFPLALECEVVDVRTVGSHTQVTGEVKAIQADESVLDGRGRVDMEELDPMVYDEEARGYFHMGERICDAYRPGAALKKRLAGSSNQ